MRLLKCGKLPEPVTTQFLEKKKKDKSEGSNMRTTPNNCSICFIELYAPLPPFVILSKFFLDTVARIS